MRPIYFSCWLLLALSTTLSCKRSDNGGGTVNPPPATKDTTFTNPLLASGPDPYVVQKDSFYYYTNTSGDRVKLWRTTAMSQLSNAYSQTVWTKPTTGANSQNIWAPEMHLLDGKWYIYYTAGSSVTDLSTQRLFVLENSSADPLSGSWTDKGKLADPAADFFAIDASVFEYNGKRYLIWSGQPSAIDNNQNIYIAPLQNPWTLAAGRTLLSSPEYNWETNGYVLGGTPKVNEGPEILKNPAGRVFLVYSASGCWTDDYALGMLTLKDGGDPLKLSDWTKNTTPVFTKNAQSNAYGPGHNGFFVSPDGKENWIIYHANPQTGQGCGDKRSPRMQKFTWNTDGTPNFGSPVPINIPVAKPSGEK